MPLLRYLAALNTARLILWCYFIWYVVVVARRFDPSPRLWITSIGLSGIIGVALLLSTRSAASQGKKTDRWVVFRLFLMPFCVSSFAAMVKDAGFILIFPPSWKECAIGLGCIALFLVAVTAVKRVKA